LQSVLLCRSHEEANGLARAISTEKRKAVAEPLLKYIQSLRGKYRGQGLLKALMLEKKREREL
jgi:hypothetical protein